MRQGQCSQCSSPESLGEMVLLEGAMVCHRCLEARAKAARAAGGRVVFQRISDRSVCARCKADQGDRDLPLVAGVPLCGTCEAHVYAYPFPPWLKASLAVLLVLFVVALWQGAPYFSAGKHLVLGRRAMDRRDYAAASAELNEVLKVGPTDQAVILLGAEANLEAGDPSGAQAFLDRRATFDSDDAYVRVDNLWEHALDAMKLAGEAGKADSLRHWTEAARLMHQASREYPQSPVLATNALVLDGEVAFDRKDYDAALTVTKAALAKEPNSPMLMGWVASALASKYAVTGAPEFRTQSEAMLTKAESLSQRDPEVKANFEEYAERIRYRLATREIIDRDEYNRRFRQNVGH